MFYLFSFLTMLISLLIYMMDPLPTYHRQSLDTYQAEAHVLGFVNQHQTARDYLYRWLGRIDPQQNNVEKRLDGNFNTGASWAPRALAIPSNIDDMMNLHGGSSSVEVERYLRDGDADSNSYLRFEPKPNEVGSYISGLVCLDTNNNLVPCYRYTVYDGGAVSENQDCSGAAGCSDADIRGIVFANNVRPFVVTYSDNTGTNPAWWGESGQTKALRYELWRRAMAHRTSGSYNCGVISEARDSDGGKGRWVVNGRGRVEWENEAGGSRYCINNGQRCRRVLPAGMETYLRQVVSSPDHDTSLSGVFFCYSEVKNPYDTIAVPTWHFDGLDNKARGSGNRFSSGAPGNQEWYPRVFPTGGWQQLAWEYGQWGGDYGTSSQFAIVPADGSGLVMPFNHTSSDFTLNVVFHFGEDTPAMGDTWLIGGMDPTKDPTLRYDNYVGGTIEGAFGLYVTDAYEFYLYVADGAVTYMSHLEVDKGRELLTTGVHSWTIVCKNGKIKVYLDGQDKWPLIESVVAFNKPNIPVVIGHGHVGVGDIRYYDRALTEAEISRNFKVDSRRYGAQAYKPTVRP